MQNKIIKTFLLLTASLMLPSFAFAAPAISTASGTFSNGQTFTLSGSSFGTKTTSAPKYFNNLENETIGQLPSDQITNISKFGTTQGNLAHGGSKSLEWDYCAQAGAFTWSETGVYTINEVVSYNSTEYSVIANVGPSSATPDADVTHYQAGRIAGINSFCTENTHNDWQRNAIDLGSSGADKIYVSAWVYLDKGSSNSTSWQWKGLPTIASSNSLYYDLPQGYPSACSGSTAWQSTAAFTAYWYFDNNRWGNPSSGLYNYNTSTCQNDNGVSTTGLPSDALLWNQWQRMEFYAQRSSASGVADGIWRGQRIGKTDYNFNYTNAITNLDGNDPWRYVVLSHAIESIYDGYLDFKLYMDDIYVDTTQARIELCDSSTWLARSHCEIQKPTTWSDTSLTVTLNQGSFSTGTAYMYVVDGSGNVNANGYAVTLAGASDTTAPSAPSGLSVL